MLRFSGGGSDDQKARGEIEDEYSHLVDYQLFALDPRVKEVFGTDRPFTVLLRPDNHIGFISTVITLGGFRASLKKIIAAPSREMAYSH